MEEELKPRKRTRVKPGYKPQAGAVYLTRNGAFYVPFKANFRGVYRLERGCFLHSYNERNSLQYIDFEDYFEVIFTSVTKVSDVVSWFFVDEQVAAKIMQHYINFIIRR